MKHVLLVATLLLCSSCGGPGTGATGGDALSEDECRQLLSKIAEITYADLSESDRAEVEDSEEQFEASVQACVADQNWDRPGFDCVMRANSEADLRICIVRR